MKRLFALSLLCALVISCSQPQDFRGFAGLDIGADFHSLEISKKFTKIMDDEYNVDKFDLGGGLGEVRNLNVALCDGKICEVRFQSTPKTNKLLVEKVKDIMIDLPTELKQNGIDYKKVYPKGFSGNDTGFYHTADNQVIFTFHDEFGHNSRPSKRYCYKSVAFSEKESAETMKRLGIAMSPKDAHK